MTQTLLPVSIAAAVLAGAVALPAAAATYPVEYGYLVASATVQTPMLVGDTLFVDTLVTTELGALNQVTTFTVGAGVASLVGNAAWDVTSVAAPTPRLTGVNIDIFDSSNTLVTSDTFAGSLGGFAISTLASNIGPGTYTLRATGTAQQSAASLDIALTFVGVVPEPGTTALMLAGLGVVATVTVRRRG